MKRIISLLCTLCLFFLPTTSRMIAQTSPFSIAASNNGQFGKIPCFTKAYSEITLVNTSTSSINIVSLRFPNSDFIVDTTLVIGIVRSSSGLLSVRRFPFPLNSNDTLTLFVTFQPFRQGAQTASMEINFSRNGQASEKITIPNVVSGYGLSLGIYSAPLTNGRDWVTQMGSYGFRTVVLRTITGDSTRIQSVALEQGGNEFALTNIIPLPDSRINLSAETFVPIQIRYTPQLTLNSSYSSSATLRVIIQYRSSIDTIRQELRAVGENPAVSRRVIRPGLRPQKDSVMSGDTAVIELFLNQSNISSLAPALLPVASDSMRALIAVNRNIIAAQPQDWFNNQWYTRELPIRQPSSWRMFEISGDGKSGSAWSGNTEVLMRMRSQAMISDTDKTPLHLLDFQWLTKDPFSYIVQQPPQPSSLTVRTCTAGGKRLFTSAPDTRIALHNTFPNPASTHVDIAYSLQEAQPVTLALYNAQGNFIRAMKSEYHEAGEYTERVAISDLATGTYFVRLQGTNGVQQKAVSVVR